MSTTINIRTDEQTKAAAEELFDNLGVSMSNAINMFLKKAIDTNSIPFEISLTYQAKANTEPQITVKEYHHASEPEDTSTAHTPHTARAHRSPRAPQFPHSHSF